jgi:hypothetical protein
MRACALGQSGATAFPPPLWGRDRERGGDNTQAQGRFWHGLPRGRLFPVALPLLLA